MNDATEKPTELVNEPQWMIVELMGHVRIAGLVTEEEKFGAKLGRIDIPGPVVEGKPEVWVTQWFGGSSVYRITATTEETARQVARLGIAAPVQAWELPKAIEAPKARPREDDDYGSRYGR